MKLHRNLLSSSHTHIGRQEIIQRRREPVHGASGTRYEVDDLSECVGTRVGAAGAPYPDAFTRKFSQCFFEGVLYGRLVKLQLKAAVIGSLVLNPEGDAAKRPIRCCPRTVLL